MFNICLKINRKWLTAIQAVCAEMSWSSLGRNSIVFDSSLSTAPERRMWKVKNQQFKTYFDISENMTNHSAHSGQSWEGILVETTFWAVKSGGQTNPQITESKEIFQSISTSVRVDVPPRLETLGLWEPPPLPGKLSTWKSNFRRFDFYQKPDISRHTARRTKAGTFTWK